MILNIIVVLLTINILIFLTATIVQLSLFRKRRGKSSGNISRNERMMERAIMALSNAIELKDSYTSGHSKRVATYAKEIARRMGKSEEEQMEIYHAGLLHDIGKIRIPDKIIRKKGKLSDMEYECLKLHPIISYTMLKGISEDGNIENAAKYHHEHYDGTGYPEGLTGKNIPEYARILAVADTYDAMTSSRSFRNLFPQKFVRSEMEYQSGKQFDPEITKLMLEIIDEDKDFILKQNENINKNILVVDDDIISSKLVEFMLTEDETFNIITVKDGAQCKKELAQTHFDLIILDIYLPDTDGFELHDFIQEKYHTPTIFMSSDKNTETIARAKKSGIKYYLVKPFLKQELNVALRDVFRHNLEP